MSPTAIGHTGFTGTSLWIDDARGVYAVLLTNRVATGASADAIQAVRRAFHDAILKENRIPIEMVRALLTKQKLTRDYAANWKFYGPIQAGN